MCIMGVRMLARVRVCFLGSTSTDATVMKKKKRIE